MLPNKSTLLACALLAATASSLVAQDGKAILDALVKKGILTTEEAKQITSEAAKPPVVAAPNSKNVTRFSMGGRIQGQYLALDTDASGATDPDTVSSFLLRRIYLSARADFGKTFSGFVTYDFAGGFFDAAYVRWNSSEKLAVDLGLRKVNLGYEERISSGALKAIERSGATRYFVEDNNGRRLGAGSYRVGAYLDGTSGNFFYGAAITDVERATSGGSGGGGAASVGPAGNNKVALWANAGFKGKSDSMSYTVGTGLGYLPEQRDAAGAVRSLESMFVGTIYGDVTFGQASVVAEVLLSDNDAGPGYQSWGFWVQPSFSISKELELVGRFSHLDSDGRGVQIGDGVRSAASVGTFDKLTDYYLGMNYYYKGNDVKLSAGLVHAKTSTVLSGAASSNSTTGLRTQVQVNF